MIVPRSGCRSGRRGRARNAAGGAGVGRRGRRPGAAAGLVGSPPPNGFGPRRSSTPSRCTLGSGVPTPRRSVHHRHHRGVPGRPLQPEHGRPAAPRPGTGAAATFGTGAVDC